MKKSITALITFAAAAAIISGTSITANAATIKGDVNGDNNITLRDATAIQKITAHSVTPTDEQSYSADFNGDGRISVLDAFLIQKYVAKDSDTLNQYAPYKETRTAFIDLVNAERIAAGAEPFEINDATLAAGNIRANEVAAGASMIRSDGSQFWTIFDECNLTYTQGYATELLQKYSKDPQALWNYIKENDSYTYEGLMSSKYTTLCVGAVPSGRSSYQWVLIYG